MTYFYRSLLIFALLICTQAKAEGLVLVVNTKHELNKFDKRQIRDIFMGQNSQFSLEPIALKPQNNARILFNTKVIGLTEARIQSYWAQMRFSGRKKAPKEVKSIEEAIEYVQQNQNTITYVPKGTAIPKDLSIVYQSE